MNAPHAEPHPYCNPANLLRMVRGGSPEALDRLTRCYGERLLSAGRRHCRTSTEAEDAVQDALLTAATRLAAFRGEGSLEGWLVRIVERACHRIARGHKNDPRRHSTDGSEPNVKAPLASHAPSPYDLTCRSELGRELQRALLTLSADDRLVLLLAEVEEWSASEIAAELGLSDGAVRTRLSRIRARMRKQLSALAQPQLQ